MTSGALRGTTVVEDIKELLVRDGALSLLVVAVVAVSCVSGSDPDPVVDEVDAEPVEKTEPDDDGPDDDGPDESEDPGEGDEPGVDEAPDDPDVAEIDEGDDTEELNAQRGGFECPAMSERMLLASHASSSPGGFDAARDVLSGGFAGPLEISSFSTFEEPISFVVISDLESYYETNGPDVADTAFALGRVQGTSGPTDATFIRSVYQAGDDIPTALEFRDGRPSIDRDLLQVDVADEVVGAAGEFGWLIGNDPSVGIDDVGEIVEYDGTVTEFDHNGALEVWWGCWKLLVQVFGPDEDLVADAVSAEMQDWVAALTDEISN